MEMSGKGSISRMSDECLMKQETVFSFYTQYQAVMRKFTLAGKTWKLENEQRISVKIAIKQHSLYQTESYPNQYKGYCIESRSYISGGIFSK